MAKATIRELCLSYLRKYSAKDLSGIESMFADDIVLRDWKIRVVGKENAINETRKNFQAAESVDIDVIETYENNNTVAAELIITVDNTEVLHVVDVITFNDQMQINSIKAYLGRGNE